MRRDNANVKFSCRCPGRGCRERINNRVAAPDVAADNTMKQAMKQATDGDAGPPSEAFLAVQ